MVDSQPAVLAALDAQRVWSHCEALGSLTEMEGGLTRVFLSSQQREANARVLAWMGAAGMAAHVDAIGNCVGRYEGERPGLPCLMLGSHLDTVRDAGKYDGTLGVVSAIECVGALHAAGTRLPFAIEVLGFGDEEGVRFGSTLLGSRAVAGTLDLALLDKQDAGGTAMRDALAQFGLDPAGIPALARKPGEVHAYAELHIEQGPVLEAEGLPVGVVTAINGGNRFAVEVTGTAGHAGTVPMTLRRDALAAAAECVAAVERIAGSMPEVVGTVGRIEALPGAMNVIPGKAAFSVDVRAPTDGQRRIAVAAIRGEFEAIARRRRVELSMTPLWEAKTAPCAQALQDQIARAIAGEGHAVRHLPSGAGHDGMALADLVPIGMLFVRCKDGVSHNPAEAVTLADVEAGLRVFARFVCSFTPP
ncbi:MAG: allantoate amidohydrolase [Burkholderiales bacterium]|nr:allantoate amidohydrolase [Burkholderiales bacterium]